MNVTIFRSLARRGAGAAPLLLLACAMHPAGEREERDRAARELAALDEPVAAEPLPENPTLTDYLRTAFHADPGLRESWWNWRAALERIPQEASPPNAALSFSYLFSDESMSAWDRTTLGLQNEPMSMLPAPTKLSTAGRRALEEARAAGERFTAAKFALQQEVTSLYLDLALHRAQMSAQEETLALLQARADDADAKLKTGRGSQDDALRARDELERAQSQLHSLHAQIPLLFARMNARLGRSAELPLPLPEMLPEVKPLELRDDELIALAAEKSPELRALARQIAGRKEALDLARQQWIPDFGLSFSVMGSVSQTLGGMVILPLRAEAIRGAIAEAQANLEAAQAARLRHARDLAASFVVNLAVLRDSERQIDLFDRVFLPRATAQARTAEAGLSTGRTTLADVVAARRTEIDTAFLLAQLRAERQKTLAAIDAWQGVDVEALHGVRMGAMSSR